MAVIEKKVWPRYFELIKQGRKPFEIRLADFEVKEGDTLLLREWDPEKGTYTGRELRVEVTYVTNTKEQKHWSKEEVERHGLWVIGFRVYNKPFFRLYENTFLTLKERFGEEQALDIFRAIMEKGLKEAYDTSGFEKGNPRDFARVVGERDKSVGLTVSFPVVEENRIIYRFHTDPFPGLRGKISPEKLDDTYMSFKVRYLLGEEWSYKNTKHLWRGDPYTEFVIFRG